MFQNPNSPAEEAEKRVLVETSLRQLSYLQGSSSIAARGVQLLSTLLNEESNQRGQRNRRSNKRKVSIEDGEAQECDRIAKRISKDVLTSPSSYPQHLASASLPAFEPTSAAYYPFDTTSPALLNPFDTIFSAPAFQNNDTQAYGSLEGESNMELWRLMDNGFESNGRRHSAEGTEALGMRMEKASGTWSS